MHLFLCAEESEAEFGHELREAFPGLKSRNPHPLLFEADFALSGGGPLARFVFVRQFLPHAQPLRAASIREWAGCLSTAAMEALPEDQPWSLHVEPQYGLRKAPHIGARAWHSATRQGSPATVPLTTERVDSEAGRQRARLVREAALELFRKKRRSLLRRLRADPAPFTSEDSVVQLVLTTPETGYLSIARAPLPFEQRHLLSPFPRGEIEPASDKSAPSRAFAKLAEALVRLGQRIQPGETCVDLGAAPGSWTWLALDQGARVIALDRSPLRDDLMADRRVQFQDGDAFRFQPPRPVDWLLCDVIAAPERTTELLLEWARRGWCRRFVVTLKLRDGPARETLAILKRELPKLASEWQLTRLCANKKEVCAFGVLNHLVKGEVHDQVRRDPLELSP